MTHHYISLDIGNKNCRCAIFIKDENNHLKLIKLGTIQTKGLTQNNIQDTETFQHSIHECIQSTKLTTKKETCQILTNIPLPETDEKLDKNPSKTIFTPLPNSKNTTPHIFNKNLESLKEAINETLQPLSGYPIHFIYEGVSICDYIFPKTNTLQELCLVDVGYNSSKIHIIKNNTPHIRHFLPIGGQTITQDLQICLKTDYDTAEKLKILACTLSTDNNKDTFIFQKENFDTQLIQKIIAARLSEWMQLLQKKTNNIPIVLYGSGSRLKNKVVFLKNKYQQNIQLLSTNALSPPCERITHTNCIAHICYANKHNLLIQPEKRKQPLLKWLTNFI